MQKFVAMHANSRYVHPEIHDVEMVSTENLFKEPQMKIPDLKEADIALLEKEIDAMTQALPPMKHFILPGGHPAVSTAHIARCVCRRAERLCVKMQANHLFVDPLVIKYLNRLSDYLFVLSRYAGQLLGAVEVAWKPRTS